MKSIRFAGLAGAVAVSIFAQSAFAYQVEDFVNYYLLENGNLGNWQLTTVNGAGTVVTALPGTGGGEQVRLEGAWSTLANPSAGVSTLSVLVPERGAGAGSQLSFSWMFATENGKTSPLQTGDRVEFFYGAVGGSQSVIPLAADHSAFGSLNVTIPLAATEIGWRIYSDNDRIADVFTVGAFTAPVPEPGTLLISGLFLAIGGIFYHQRRKTAA
jgi:hypothetical protein